MQELKKISSDFKELSIEDLPLSQTLKNKLLKYSTITNLSELLNSDYSKILNIRMLGDSGLQELKNYVHNLGYQFANEISTPQELKEERKKSGQKLLEDYGFPNNLCHPLYKEGIFTLEDLLEIGTEVKNVSGIGNIKFHVLQEKLLEIGIHLKNVSPNQNIEISCIKSLQRDNLSIQQRLLKKRQLLMDYENLLLEKEELLKKEQELDQKMDQILLEIHQLRKKGVSRKKRKEN